jgi:hypothetical protein
LHPDPILVFRDMHECDITLKALLTESLGAILRWIGSTAVVK